MVAKTPIVLTVNGERRKVDTDPDRTLLDVLRDDLDLTGAKEACDVGECGSCIVLFGSKGVMSCLLPVRRAQGKEITTIEGLAPRYHQGLTPGALSVSELHPLQDAFIDLGASQCGFCIPGYSEGQGKVIHLVASAETIRDAELGFVFTDGHAVMAMSSFYDDLADLDRIDWAVMESKFWNDTLEDGDRKRRRQAEFLVHQYLPWDQIHAIGVLNTTAKAEVEAIIIEQSHQPPVIIRRTWYY